MKASKGLKMVCWLPALVVVCLFITNCHAQAEVQEIEISAKDNVILMDGRKDVAVSVTLPAGSYLATLTESTLTTNRLASNEDRPIVFMDGAGSTPVHRFQSLNGIGDRHAFELADERTIYLFFPDRQNVNDNGGSATVDIQGIDNDFSQSVTVDGVANAFLLPANNRVHVELPPGFYRYALQDSSLSNNAFDPDGRRDMIVIEGAGAMTAGPNPTRYITLNGIGDSFIAENDITSNVYFSFPDSQTGDDNAGSAIVRIEPVVDPIDITVSATEDAILMNDIRETGLEVDLPPGSYVVTLTDSTLTTNRFASNENRPLVFMEKAGSVLVYRFQSLNGIGDRHAFELDQERTITFFFPDRQDASDNGGTASIEIVGIDNGFSQTVTVDGIANAVLLPPDTGKQYQLPAGTYRFVLQQSSLSNNNNDPLGGRDFLLIEGAGSISAGPNSSRYRILSGIGDSFIATSDVEETLRVSFPDFTNASDNAGEAILRIESTDPIGQDEDNESIVIDLPGLTEGAKLFEMILIPAGTFTMGSPDDERGRESYEGPQHEVTITRPFYMGTYEVTQAQWYSMMGANPSSGYGVGDNYPVYSVNWNDCQAFIQNLNELGQGMFRLPTEAEWEYACRSGTTTRFSFGDALECSEQGDYCELADQYMWWRGNNTYNGNEYGSKEVGLKLANPWGLFDMHGNIYEWCQDWYGDYASNAVVDPQGPETGTERILRGGGWRGITANRSARRYSAPPASPHESFRMGLRVVKVFEEDEERITCTSPTGGTYWVGQSIPVSWEHGQGTEVVIEVYPDDESAIPVCRIHTDNDARYDLDPDGNDCPLSPGRYYIHVYNGTNYPNGGYSSPRAYFSIGEEERISCTSPDDETYNAGQTIHVSWEHGQGTEVVIEVYPDDDSAIPVCRIHTDNDGNYDLNPGGADCPLSPGRYYIHVYNGTNYPNGGYSSPRAYFSIGGDIEGNAPLRVFTFDEANLEDAGFVPLPGGFTPEDYGAGSVQIGTVPSGQGFEGATDGRGLLFIVTGGQASAVLGPPIDVEGKPVIIRASVHSNGGNAAVQMGVLPATSGQPDSSMALQQIISSQPFQNEWKRLIFFNDPPAPTTQVLPFIQIASLSNQDSVTLVYVDNLEIYVLEGDGSWSDSFFGADGTGP